MMELRLLLFFIGISGSVFAQKARKIELHWQQPKQHTAGDYIFKYPFFEDKSFCVLLDEKAIVCKETFEVQGVVNPNTLSVKNVRYQDITQNELFDLDLKKIPTQLNVTLETASARGKNIAVLQFSPIIKSETGYKKVIELEADFSFGSAFREIAPQLSIQQSVLASGSWHRFYVEHSGVYKVTKSFLKNLGFNVNVNPRNIKLYGNGGRMLPLLNSEPYPDDLAENAIQFIGEEDEIFNDEDYFLFYAEGVDKWNTESLTSRNLYSDKSYYYITSSTGTGKRIAEATQPSNTSDMTFTTYDAVHIYEKELVNAGKIGRRWFGEQFNVDVSQNFKLNIPNIDTSVPLQIKINMASKSFGSSSFQIRLNSQAIGTVSFSPVNTVSGVQGYENVLNTTISAESSELTFNLIYNNGGVPLANGYLDFIRVKAKCNLNGYGKQFLFYNEAQANNIGVAEFRISNASGIHQIWDITDSYNVSKYNNSGSNVFSFKTNLGTQRYYQAVDGNDLYTPLADRNASVQNQNLKGTVFQNPQGVFQDIDYLIIAPQFLVNSAEKLANFHRNTSGLNVKVIALESIYHEFSSGKQDIAAIRNFIKYVYWNASSPEKRVKYVNLFGDASYDYKNRITNNTNVVPVFHGFNPNASEINNSSNFSLYSTFMSDDFFGLMDSNEGRMLGGIDGIDIAVGRMLVNSVSQADAMVEKVKQYYAESSYGRWRNNYVIYSDDADDASDASLQVGLDNLAETLVSEKPFVNVKKIHTDAYVQQITAGGERYPEAKRDFLDAIQNGALVLNYFGHGNEEFLARERLFDRNDAKTLHNPYRYPLFITITCEFTRFDDPSRETGGEFMYWNTKGGAVSLIATTRQIGVTTGFNMNNTLSKELYAFGSNNYPTVSEALRLTKIQTGSDNRRVVFYIGDPALQLAIPKPKAVLTKVNGVSITSGEPLPVFKALNTMTVEGEITDENNVLLPDYNGEVAVQIFDKDINRATLGNNGVRNNQGDLITMNFRTLGETIFRGNASVTNGKFTLSFVVPQDIRIAEGNGKISFYAKRKTPSLQDQTGYNRDITVGGVNTDAPADNTPPTARLYMNDENFVQGGITNCSPILIAQLYDENGINTAGGIGHDIIAILDGNEANPYVLNDFYETELDNHSKGIVRFPFRNLSAGLHTILFKAWDVYNNPVSAEIQFNAVCSDEGLKIERVLNYPNPFVSYTEFWFTHNMPFELLDVQVQIFTVSGKVVKSINQQVLTDGFLCRTIQWDGRDDFGQRIGKGVYVYKLTVKSVSSGKRTEKYEKLVVL